MNISVTFILPAAATVGLFCLVSCGRKSTPPVPAPPTSQPPVATAPAAPAAAAPEVLTFSLTNMDDWKKVENAVGGTVSAQDGVMKLGNGDGVTAVVYQGKATLPLVDYELAWEARQMDGVDFFAAATFPVRKLTECGTLINGGWGGGVTGISCIDSMAANENNTTKLINYEPKKWYKFRIQVTAEMLVGYVEDKKEINVNITEKKVSLRPGDIEMCAPLGFASYQSRGEIRNITIRKLKPGEVPLDPEAY